MTILVSCHHWPIQPRVGIHRLELNQAGVIWRQKIGSKLWNRKSRNSPNVSKNILRSIINMLTSNYKRRKCLVVSQRPMEWHFEMCVQLSWWGAGQGPSVAVEVKGNFVSPEGQRGEAEWVMAQQESLLCREKGGPGNSWRRVLSNIGEGGE